MLTLELEVRKTRDDCLTPLSIILLMRRYIQTFKLLIISHVVDCGDEVDGGDDGMGENQEFESLDVSTHK